MALITLNFPKHIENCFCDSSNAKFYPDANRQVVVDSGSVRLQEFTSVGFTYAPPTAAAT